MSYGARVVGGVKVSDDEAEDIQVELLVRMIKAIDRY